MALAHFVNISYSSINQGLIWAIMVLGLYLSFRVLDFSDLTADASLTMGAAICAAHITAGGTPLMGMLLATAGGALAGLSTALLHTQLRIPSLLSGILTQTALYSINLRIMDSSFLALYKIDTLFSQFADYFQLASTLSQLICATIIVTLLIVLLWWFLNTELGMAVRATGNNQRMIRALGVNANSMIILCLMLSNAIIALGGSAVSMHQGFADIQMGIGTIVVALAGIIIGEELFGGRTLISKLTGVVCGSVVYRFLIAMVLEINPNPNDTRLVTAILVVFALSIPLIKKGIRTLRNTDGGEPQDAQPLPVMHAAPATAPATSTQRQELLAAFENTLAVTDDAALSPEDRQQLTHFKQQFQEVRALLADEPGQPRQDDQKH